MGIVRAAILAVLTMALLGLHGCGRTSGPAAAPASTRDADIITADDATAVRTSRRLKASRPSEFASAAISPPTATTGPSLAINNETRSTATGEEAVEPPTGQALGAGMLRLAVAFGVLSMGIISCFVVLVLAPARKTVSEPQRGSYREGTASSWRHCGAHRNEKKNTSAAVRNYARFHGLAEKTVLVSDIERSSAGLDGWSDARVGNDAEAQAAQAFVGHMRQLGRLNWVVYGGCALDLNDPKDIASLSDEIIAQLVGEATLEAEVIEIELSYKV